MASIESSSVENAARESRDRMQVTPYDRVASMLVTLLLLVGFVVGILFLLFLTMRIVASHEPMPLEFMEDLESSMTMDAGSGEDFEEPGLEEMQELPEPQLSQMMEAVTDAVTSQPAALDALDGDADATGRGRGRGGPPAPDIIPFGRRTKIHYGETSLTSYGEILDHFQIELAAAGGGRATVDYASKFSQTKPETRSGSPQEERRVYLIWRRGSKLEETDRKLLAQAGVDTENRQVMQFLPTQVEQILRRLEKQKAGGRDERMLRMTVYRVKKQGRRYEFFVMTQEYRTPR